MKRPLMIAATLALTVAGLVTGVPAQAAPTAVTVPSAPTSVTSSKTRTTATLEWAEPSSTGGESITGYRLSHYNFETILSPSTRSFTFTGLQPGTPYNLYVQAINSSGRGPNVVVLVTTAAITTPSVTRSVTSSQTSTSATLKWVAPLSTGGSDITGYRLSRYGYEKVVSPTTRSFTFTGLKPGTPYNLYLQAKNAKGLSPTVRTLVTTALTPKAYSDCAALNNDYAHGVGKSGARDQTSGTPVTDFYQNNALYAMNDGRDATKRQYDLDRDNDGISCER